MTNHWWTCESKDGTCVHDGDRISKLKNKVPRCIQHGAILTYQKAYDGMGRAEIRASLGSQRKPPRKAKKTPKKEHSTFKPFPPDDGEPVLGRDVAQEAKHLTKAVKLYEKPLAPTPAAAEPPKTRADEGKRWVIKRKGQERYIQSLCYTALREEEKWMPLPWAFISLIKEGAEFYAKRMLGPDASTYELVQVNFPFSENFPSRNK